MKPLWVLAVAAFSGCGTIYVSPNIRSVATADDPALQVVVVPLTVETARSANRSTYVPQTLPAVFSTTTRAPVLRRDDSDGAAALAMRLPPKLGEIPYHLGVGDVVALRGTSSITETTASADRRGLRVQDSGVISIPGAGRVRVAELTLEQAEAEVFQALVTAQIDPTFSLEITAFNARRVTVGGAVKTPVLVPITLRPLYLEEALQLAGGAVTPDQDYATVRLHRDGKTYLIPLRQLNARADLKRIRLKDGDSVLVEAASDIEAAQALEALKAGFDIDQARAEEARGTFVDKNALGAIRRDYVYLTGEVASQSRFALPFEHTANLADALYAEGGISSREGNLSEIYLLRGNGTGGGVTAYHLNARNAANLVLATQMELRPNDIIFVAEQPVTRWNRVVAQLVPSLIVAGATALAASQ